MICESCGQAGDANKRGDYDLALMLHAACPDPSCPCLHRIGKQWINPERVHIT